MAANQTHGLRRSNEDKAKTVKKALSHPNAASKSVREIAEYIGVSHMTVQRYRDEMKSTVTKLQSDERTGRDGRTIDTANIGVTHPFVGKIRAQIGNATGNDYQSTES